MSDNYYEESDYFPGRKEARLERKLASKLDRSKYKKTDKEKHKRRDIAPHAKEDAVSGIVTSIRAQDVYVESQGIKFCCSLRGVLKKEKHKLKNLIIVGDNVQFEKTGQDAGVIVAIDERKTVLSRADHLSQQKEHLIAANVDKVLITISVINPPLRTNIIDRYLIAALKGNLSPVILCNKTDLLNDPSLSEEERENERTLMLELKKIYQQIGIPFITLSCESKEGLDELTAIMKDHISVFSGQSGTGKSSIINATCGLNLKVRETVQSSKKGAHTTSYAELIKLPFGGYVVDTPGIKSFGVWDLSASELPQLFPEIYDASHKCKFQDCTHRGETGCYIEEAIKEGLVSRLRYESYLSLLSSIESEHLRR